MATAMLQIVILNEINVTGCDGFVDVAHGLGEPRIFVSVLCRDVFSFVHAYEVFSSYVLS